MNYEKKYEEALERAKKELPSCGNGRAKMLERIFPELKESEDERIRKALIRYFTLSDEHAYNEACGVSYRNIVAWLEKQNKTKEKLNESEWSRDDEQYLLVCKNALAKYQVTDKWDANIIYNWLKNKLQKNYDNRRKS